MIMKHSSTQSGNILFIILIAVAIIGALGAVMMNNGGSQASSMASDQISQKLKSQIDLIKAALNECNLTHEFGYPVGMGTKVRDLQCQIDSTPNFVDIFPTLDKTKVEPLPNFSQWLYDNNDPGISIYMDGNKPADPVYINAITMLASQYNPSEIDVVNDGVGTLSVRIHLTKP